MCGARIRAKDRTGIGVAPRLDLASIVAVVAVVAVRVQSVCRAVYMYTSLAVLLSYFSC